MNANNDYQSNWAYLTELVLLQIFQYLEIRDVLNAGAVCRNWNAISYDNLLWRSYFRKDFNIDSSINIKPGKTSWYKEYKRLTYHAPFVETEVLKSHAGPVVNVTFSHDGKYFVTCAMDGLILVWNSSYPASIKYSYDMKQFSWQSTHYAEFNEVDTLLLVFGNNFGKINDSFGETAIFSFKSKMTLIGRISNKPYDVFGTFYSDEYILSGQVQHFGPFVCASSVCIHEAYPDITLEHKPLISRLFRFLNVNTSFIRNLIVATCKYNNIESDNGNDSRVPSVSKVRVQETDVSFDSKFIEYNKLPRFIFHRDYESVESISSTLSDSESLKNENLSEQSSHNEDDLKVNSDDDLLLQPEKYLIFTTGCKTDIPHQISIKKIGQIEFPKKLDPGPSLTERIAECKQRATIDDVNIEDSSKKFDSIDHLIELHGHIIGMKLSPDHRYLYVNCRPWPEGYVITNTLDPPPVAQEIEIHVIDLITFKEVDVMLRANKAYTPSDECSQMFLDICNDYIASGSEDRHGYLLDRHYGINLTKFPHFDVVNDVAFNPKDPETLVTVSDDNLIKIWRSRARTSQLFSTKIDYPRAVKLSPKRNISEKRGLRNKLYVL